LVRPVTVMGDAVSVSDPAVPPLLLVQSAV
jgi:hypothetical protein